MSEIDLILLGLIKQGPKSAYDLEKQIEYRQLSYWVKISKASIYKNIKQLEAKGYIKKESIRNGNMPVKDIYTLTSAGDEFMQEAILEISNKPLNFFLSINTVILNLKHIGTEQQIQCLDNMEEQIKRLKNHIIDIQAKREHIPVEGKMIIQQQRNLAEYLDKWLVELRSNGFPEKH